MTKAKNKPAATSKAKSKTTAVPAGSAAKTMVDNSLAKEPPKQKVDTAPEKLPQGKIDTASKTGHEEVIARSTPVTKNPDVMNKGMPISQAVALGYHKNKDKILKALGGAVDQCKDGYGNIQDSLVQDVLIGRIEYGFLSREILK